MSLKPGCSCDSAGSTATQFHPSPVLSHRRGIFSANGLQSRPNLHPVRASQMAVPQEIRQAQTIVWRKHKDPANAQHRDTAEDGGCRDGNRDGPANIGAKRRCVIPLLNAVWETDYGDPSRKLVMLCLADMANKDGVCWPSVATIGRRCSLSKRPVQRHLKALQAMGALAVTRRFKDGFCASNDYKIMMGGSVVDDRGVVSWTPPRTTNRTNGAKDAAWIDPKALLTRATQLPPSRRGKRK